MKHIISILSITLLFSLCVTAQNNATKKADKHFNKFEFRESLLLFSFDIKLIGYQKYKFFKD